MPVPTVITDLSTTIASNSPAGSESAAATDDYLRAHAGFIAQLYAVVGRTTALTASRALATDASAGFTATAVTSTELGYVSGVTSAIQTQINAKAPTASPTFTGNVTAPTMSLSSGQLVFPAAQNASTNANTLDDYEEGTFTPNDASGAALPMSAASGAYVKVGKIVAFVANVTYTSTANGSAAKIGGLPFTAASYNFPAALTTGTTNLAFCAVIAGTTTIGLYTNVGGGTTNAQLSGLAVQVSGWYMATA